MDKYDQLDKLKKLLDEGTINQEEFELEKSKLLAAGSGGSKQLMGLGEQEYTVFLHVSQFLGFILPFAGLVVPIVMWAIGKDDSEKVDAHGKVVMNWILSSIIYFVGSIILIFAFIGIPLLIGLIICDIVFVIIGAVKASKGELWPYPLSIPFFKIDRSEI